MPSSCARKVCSTKGSSPELLRFIMIVMKFGGTSLQDAAAIQRCIEAVSLQGPLPIAVVLSAMGKSTNRLLEIAQLASSQELERARRVAQELHDYHLSVSGDLISGPRLKQVSLGLGVLFEELSDLIKATVEMGECPPRILDSIASLGERMSTLVFAAALGESGSQDALLDSRDFVRTDDQFTQARILPEITEESIRSQLEPVLAEGKTAIAQGFIGSTLEGVTTTIGRGGSDYTASLLGAALEARDIQIWTDVPGVLTADPRIVPGAFKIKAISFAEAAELAYFGAKVLHPSTLLPAIDKNIPIHVCSSRQIRQPGTLISTDSIPSETSVKSIACKKGIAIVNIESYRMLLAHGFLRRIFEVFDKHEKVVDAVATTEVSVSLTVDTTEKLDAIIKDLEKFGDVEIQPNKGIICAVGDSLRCTPGIAWRIFRSLNDINIEMISQGASQISVTFLVQEDKMEEAVRRLHHEFFVGPDPKLFEPVGQLDP